MLKINDTVKTPQGNAVILLINKNGVINLKLTEPPFTEIFVHKSQTKDYVILKRPRKIHFGRIGHISDGPYQATANGRPTPIYQAWRSMLHKSSEADIFETISVYEDWFDFQNFAAWYDRTKPTVSDDVRWVLDKHLLVPGNTNYNPDVCCIIPQQITSAFVFKRPERRLPMGVSKNPTNAFYSVHLSRQLVGQAKTVDEAKAMYWRAKTDSIRALAIRYWSCLPESLAMRLIQFGPTDAIAYFPSEFDK